MTERILVNPKKKQRDCTVWGKKDDFQNWILNMGLPQFMSSVLDFIQQEALLQYHGCPTGIVANETPETEDIAPKEK